jgi:hypothetical protein
MPLTDAQVKKALKGEKDYKLADSAGLYLYVTTKGSKSWRMKYRFAGKEKRLVFGLYPEVSLAKARAERDRARQLLREHRDPATEQRKRKMAAHAAAGATFRVVGTRWHEAQKPRWSTTQAVKVEQALERDVYPVIGSMSLIDIDGPTVLSMLRKVEKRGAIDTAKRIRQHVSAVFCFGIAEGLCAVDPAAGIKKAMLPTPIGGSQPGVNTVEAVRTLHATIDKCSSNPSSRLASRLLGLTFVRPGLIPTARWIEFEGIDWDDPTGANDAPEPIWRVEVSPTRPCRKESQAVFGRQNLEGSARDGHDPIPSAAGEIWIGAAASGRNHVRFRSRHEACASARGLAQPRSAPVRGCRRSSVARAG